MSKRFMPVLPFLALLLSNCGGGGGGGSSIVPNQPVPAQSTGKAQIKLTIPNASSVTSHARSPKFVSSGAQGATIAAGPHGGTLTTTTFDLTSNSICTGTTTRTCTLTVTLPSGNDDLTITLYLLAPVNGAIPSQAPILGVSSATNVPIIPTQTAQIVAYVMPTIASVTTATPGFLTVPADGAVHATQVLFNPVDYSNHPIVAGANDNYSNPITVSVAETGGSGHVILSRNGGASATTVTLTQSADSLGIAYDGGGAPGYYATVTATATGVSPQTFHIVPMIVTSSQSYYANHALAFTGSAQSATLTISEALGFNSYTSSYSSTPACTGAAISNAATGSGASGQTVIGSLTGPAASTDNCALQISDGTTNFNIPLTNTLTNGGVTVGGIIEYATPVDSPNQIVSGADGNLYVTATLSNASTFTGSTIWTYTTAGVSTGAWSNALPADPVAITIGSDGHLWFASNDGNTYTWNALNAGSIGTASVAGASKINGIALGPDGNIWATDFTNDAVYQLAAINGSLMSSFPLSASPTLITSQSGSLWIVFPGAAAQLVRITPGSGPAGEPSLPGVSPGPSAIAPDHAGNLWVAEQTANEIDEFDGTIWTQYPIGASSSPAGIVVGPDGNVWFTEPATNSIGRFNVTTHVFSHFSIPTPSSNPSAMTVGSDGRIWFTESAVGQLGAVTP